MPGPSNGHDAADAQNDATDAMAEQLTSPTALRKLVLNYLIHHCYVDTAQAFADDGISSAVGPSSSSAAMDTGHSLHPDSRRNGDGPGGSGEASVRGSQASGSRWPSHSRSTSARGQAHTSAHPLSAPPLSREDSSMEIEVDSLLALASADGSSGSGARTGASRNGASAATTMNPDMENLSGGDLAGNEELTAEELQSVRIRKEIRDHIVAGRIRQAIELCNRQFPSVLLASGSDRNASAEGSASKLSVRGTGTRSLTQAAEARPTEADKTKGNGTTTSETTVRILPANPTSLDPAHLWLNLQIQAFIESVRSASTFGSTSTSPTMATTLAPTGMQQGVSAMPNMHSIVSNTPGIASAAAAVSRSASPAPSSSSSTGSVTSANGLSASAHSNGGSSAMVNPGVHAALHHAQVLYGEVQKLPAYWRAMYLKELESVTTLLAYTDVEHSPVRKYLDQSRRVALAEQINSAIMLRTGKPSQPLIESAVRQTTFSWYTLSYEKVLIPANHRLFSSGAVVGLDPFDAATSTSALTTALAASSAHDRSKSGGGGGGKGKTVPSWDLHSFLRER